MKKENVFKLEYEKLTEVFKDIDEGKQKLVEGLIQDAACLYAENFELRNLINEIGMLKINPSNRSMQKQTEVGKQYLKNINSYSVIIKTLNGVLQKSTLDDDDEFDNWVEEMKNNNG